MKSYAVSHLAIARTPLCRREVGCTPKTRKGPAVSPLGFVATAACRRAGASGLVSRKCSTCLAESYILRLYASAMYDCSTILSTLLMSTWLYLPCGQPPRLTGAARRTEAWPARLTETKVP